MEWLERMNRALAYIEANITVEISMEEVAKLACCSSYHFQRMFSFITGVPLAEYIRRRRLTMAALDLQSGNSRVIDVALTYGYDSPDAFTRAFHKLHGMTPSAAREPGVKLKAYPRLTFHLSVKGDKDMDIKQMIGARIKDIRTKKGFTQEQLAEKIEINSKYLSSIERGLENPTLNTLIRMSESLDVSFTEFFNHVILDGLLDKTMGLLLYFKSKTRSKSNSPKNPCWVFYKAKVI